VRVPIALTYSSGKGLAVLGRLWPVVVFVLSYVLLPDPVVVLVCAPAEPAVTTTRSAPQMARVLFIVVPFLHTV